MKITFIRHSKTNPTKEIPISQWGLTSEGRKLAEYLSQKAEIKDLNVIYSSLQTKALETAVILAKPHGIPIKTHPDLTEISSFTRKFFDLKTLEKNVAEFYSKEIERISGGESITEALSRFQQSLERIIEKEKNAKNIGIISHGNILSFFTSQYCNKTPAELRESISMPDLAILDWETRKFTKFFGEI